MRRRGTRRKSNLNYMFISYFYITAYSLENIARFVEASNGTPICGPSQVKIGRRSVFVQIISLQCNSSKREHALAGLINVRTALNLTDKDVGIVNEKV